MIHKSEAGLYSTNLICTSIPSMSVFQDCSFNLENLVRLQKSKTRDDGIDSTFKDIKVTLTGGMRAHRHGLPTSPTVKWNGQENKYQIKGLKFSMPGKWFLRFHIHDTDKTIKDAVEFKFKVK